jgi:hypothetical protein
MNKMRWVVEPDETYLEVYEPNGRGYEWKNYKQSVHYEKEYCADFSKGMRTMQNCLKVGYQLVDTVRKGDK